MRDVSKRTMGGKEGGGLEKSVRKKKNWGCMQHRGKEAKMSGDQRGNKDPHGFGIPSN